MSVKFIPIEEFLQRGKIDHATQRLANAVEAVNQCIDDALAADVYFNISTEERPVGKKPGKVILSIMESPDAE